MSEFCVFDLDYMHICPRLSARLLRVLDGMLMMGFAAVIYSLFTICSELPL